MIRTAAAVSIVFFSGTLVLAHRAGAADPPPGPSSARPDDPLAEARTLTDRESWEEAAEKFRDFLEKNPNSSFAPEARFWTGYCLEKLEQYESAVEILQPFLTSLAEDTWADDALLKLGAAHHGLGQDQKALAAWKRQIEKYPTSVWRTEVYLSIIDVLFHGTADLVECLAYCERVTKEVADRDSTTEARYLGAYCLNALRRFGESEAWADRLFDPESPLEEAWRRLLAAQRDLLQGRPESALASVDAFADDFPDLDHDARQDLLVRTCYVLRFNGRADRARELLLDELRKSSGRAEEEIGSLLDALSDAFGEDRRDDYFKALKTLVNTRGTPLVVRVVARERRAEGLRESDADLAESSLREALHDEPTEYGRVRAATQLATILSEDRDDHLGAVRVLEDLLPHLKRRDLVHQVRNAAEELRAAKP
ncbi:MAG: tetratricopeptide repeat protein [Isosphaeraceae bacterium]|nr:tetratricopeptide repeat protein [Isosphaeraceae bacterium]